MSCVCCLSISPSKELRFRSRPRCFDEKMHLREPAVVTGPLATPLHCQTHGGQDNNNNRVCVSENFFLLDDNWKIKGHIWQSYKKQIYTPNMNCEFLVSLWVSRERWLKFLSIYEWVIDLSELIIIFNFNKVWRCITFVISLAIWVFVFFFFPVSI